MEGWSAFKAGAAGFDGKLYGVVMGTGGDEEKKGPFLVEKKGACCAQLRKPRHSPLLCHPEFSGT